MAFTRDLPAFEWDVDVLTVAERALPARTNERVADLPKDTRVIRAFALDTARHLSLFGKYPRPLALPDRWVSWRMGGLLAGMRYARTTRPDAIMSTFPIATAHLIALGLHRRTGIPWIADFRDPMAQDEYPANRCEWESYAAVERAVVDEASAMTFTAPGAKRYYLERYGDQISARMHVVPNGFEEHIFSAVETERALNNRNRGELIFLHSGFLYPWERNPLPFFEALRNLADAGFWHDHPSRFVFRASGYEEHYRPLVGELGLNDLVEFPDRLEYRAALAEMLDADALLLFQARNSNFQIPAKTYEYLRARRPIFAVIDPGGDARELLDEAEADLVAAIDSPAEIAVNLRRFVAEIGPRTEAARTRENIQRFSRRAAARTLSSLLGEIVPSG